MKAVSFLEHLYNKIKELRRKKELTLKELSEITGLSISFLSQIERGSTSLAITSLKKIADAFNVNISYFFTDISTNNYVTRKDEQHPFNIEGSEVKHIRLSGEFDNRKIEPFIVILPPNKEFKEKFSHPGEEFYYVLKGEVIFKVNENNYRLREGDSIHFPSKEVHMWRNPVSKDTKLMSILTPALF